MTTAAFIAVVLACTTIAAVAAAIAWAALLTKTDNHGGDAD